MAENGLAALLAQAERGELDTPDALSGIDSDESSEQTSDDDGSDGSDAGSDGGEAGKSPASSTTGERVRGPDGKFVSAKSQDSATAGQKAPPPPTPGQAAAPKPPAAGTPQAQPPTQKQLAAWDPDDPATWGEEGTPIPYTRFSKVIEKRNAAEQRAAAAEERARFLEQQLLNQRFSPQSQQQTEPRAGADPRTQQVIDEVWGREADDPLVQEVQSLRQWRQQFEQQQRYQEASSRLDSAMSAARQRFPDMDDDLVYGYLAAKGLGAEHVEDVAEYLENRIHGIAQKRFGGQKAPAPTAASQLATRQPPPAPPRPQASGSGNVAKTGDKPSFDHIKDPEERKAAVAAYIIAKYGQD